MTGLLEKEVDIAGIHHGVMRGGSLKVVTNIPDRITFMTEDIGLINKTPVFLTYLIAFAAHFVSKYFVVQS